MKWFGDIAFSNQVEENYVWKDEPIIKKYYGDVQRLSKRDQLTSTTTNPDISITNTLSVVADPFLLNSFQDILYVTFMGSKWRVSSVEVSYPRLTLTLGSLYKEETSEDMG